MQDTDISNTEYMLNLILYHGEKGVHVLPRILPVSRSRGQQRFLHKEGSKESAAQ